MPYDIILNRWIILFLDMEFVPPGGDCTKGPCKHGFFCNKEGKCKNDETGFFIDLS